MQLISFFTHLNNGSYELDTQRNDHCIQKFRNYLNVKGCPINCGSNLRAVLFRITNN